MVVGPTNKVKGQKKLLGPHPCPIATALSEAQALLGKLLSEEGPGPCLLLGHWPQLALYVAQGSSGDKGLLSVVVSDGRNSWVSIHICFTVYCPAASPLSKRK